MKLLSEFAGLVGANVPDSMLLDGYLIELHRSKANELMTRLELALDYDGLKRAAARAVENFAGNSDRTEALRLLREAAGQLERDHAVMGHLLNGPTGGAQEFGELFSDFMGTKNPVSLATTSLPNIMSHVPSAAIRQELITDQRPVEYGVNFRWNSRTRSSIKLKSIPDNWRAAKNKPSQEFKDFQKALSALKIHVKVKQAEAMVNIGGSDWRLTLENGRVLDLVLNGGTYEVVEDTPMTVRVHGVDLSHMNSGRNSGAGWIARIIAGDENKSFMSMDVGGKWHDKSRKSDAVMNAVHIPIAELNLVLNLMTDEEIEAANEKLREIRGALA